MRKDNGYRKQMRSHNILNEPHDPAEIELLLRKIYVLYK